MQHLAPIMMHSLAAAMHCSNALHSLLNGMQGKAKAQLEVGATGSPENVSLVSAVCKGPALIWLPGAGHMLVAVPALQENGFGRQRLLLAPRSRRSRVSQSNLAEVGIKLGDPPLCMVMCRCCPKAVRQQT